MQFIRRNSAVIHRRAVLCRNLASCHVLQLKVIPSQRYTRLHGSKHVKPAPHLKRPLDYSRSERRRGDSTRLRPFLVQVELYTVQNLRILNRLPRLRGTNRHGSQPLLPDLNASGPEKERIHLETDVFDGLFVGYWGYVYVCDSHFKHANARLREV